MRIKIKCAKILKNKTVEESIPRNALLKKADFQKEKAIFGENKIDIFNKNTRLSLKI